MFIHALAVSIPPKRDSFEEMWPSCEKMGGDFLAQWGCESVKDFSQEYSNSGFFLAEKGDVPFWRKQISSWQCFVTFLGWLSDPLTLNRKGIHIPPKGNMKIIDSKVPNGRGFVSFREGTSIYILFHEDQKDFSYNRELYTTHMKVGGFNVLLFALLWGKWSNLMMFKGVEVEGGK